MPENNTSSSPESGQTPPAGDLTGQTPNPQGQTPSGTQKTSIDSLPSDIQEYIARLRGEAEEANKQKKAEAKAKQQAEETRLAEQGEFKKLAEQHEAKIKELEPIVERYHTLAEQVKTKIAAEIKNWPAEIMAFYPGEHAPVEQINEWYTRSQPLLEKLQLQARGTQPGNSPNPRPQGQTPESASNTYLQRLRSSGKYGA